jgi:spore maturation protein CgeB
MQMKHTVNQRVFDVAACGSFLLTDRMPDMEDFFEPDVESVCYDSVDEAVDLAGYYRNNNKERDKIAKAARKRVLAEHTYENRMSVLVAHMRERFL